MQYNALTPLVSYIASFVSAAPCYPVILGLVDNSMSEFRIGPAIDQRATGHPGRKFRYIGADTGNMCSRRQTGQNLGERLCNPGHVNLSASIDD